MNEREANRISVCAIFATAIAVSGCTSIWKDVPKSEPANRVVRLDASWFVENPSEDLVQRVAEERRQHISATLENRAAGKTGVPLEVALGFPTSDSSAPHEEAHPAIVLDQQSASESATNQAESEDGPLVIEFADGRKLTGKEDEE